MSKQFESRLEQTSTLLPSKGILGVALPILGLLGLVAATFDFGMPGLEKAIVWIGAFAAGVVLSRSLPVWRDAKPGELDRIQRMRELSPLAPWIRIATNFGWPHAIGLFVVICVVLAILAKAI